MKKLLLIILGLLMVDHAKSQNNYNDSIKNEIGISMLPFIALVDNQVSIPDLLFQYKRHLKRSNFRLGFFLGSGDQSSDIQKRIVNFNDTAGFVEHNFSSESHYFGLRVGLDRSMRKGRKWNSFIGSDLILGYKENRTYDDPVQFVKVNDSTMEAHTINPSVTTGKSMYQFGISPLVGFEYFFIPQLSASLVGHLNILYSTEGFTGHTSSEISGDTKFYLMLNYHFGKKQ